MPATAIPEKKDLDNLCLLYIQTQLLKHSVHGATLEDGMEIATGAKCRSQAIRSVSLFCGNYIDFV